MSRLNNVVSISVLRQVKQSEAEEIVYQSQILSMTKLELLDEMVRFQEERSRLGELTLSMMVRGKHLFKALEDAAETQELRILSRSYRRHLEHEITALLQLKEAGSAK
jgi:hypothetical protein